MRILFDQATPLPLRAFLKGHTVKSAWEQGWDRLKNGDLLDAAERDGFEILLTTDRNMSYQQKMDGRRIAVVVLGRQQWPDLRPHVALIVRALAGARPGTFTEVEIP